MPVLLDLEVRRWCSLAWLDPGDLARAGLAWGRWRCCWRWWRREAVGDAGGGWWRMEELLQPFFHLHTFGWCCQASDLVSGRWAVARVGHIGAPDIIIFRSKTQGASGFKIIKPDDRKHPTGSTQYIRKENGRSQSTIHATGRSLNDIEEKLQLPSSQSKTKRSTAN